MRKLIAIHPTHRTPLGLHCPTDLPGRYWDSSDVYVVRLSRWFDSDGFERGERINGYDQCPRCGLWWPNEEEPCAWEGSDGGEPSCWVAVDWWGAAVCEACELLMVEQPDGRPETYSLK